MFTFQKAITNTLGLISQSLWVRKIEVLVCRSERKKEHKKLTFVHSICLSSTMTYNITVIIITILYIMSQDSQVLLMRYEGTELNITQLPPSRKVSWVIISEEVHLNNGEDTKMKTSDTRKAGCLQCMVPYCHNRWLQLLLLLVTA